MSKDKQDEINIKAKRKSIKSYNVDVKFWNEVTEDYDYISYTVFARNITEIEKKVKNDCGEHYIGIVILEENDTIPIP